MQSELQNQISVKNLSEKKQVYSVLNFFIEKISHKLLN